jgi:sulfoxide reductase heme-binding subunit YedZ
MSDRAIRLVLKPLVFLAGVAPALYWPWMAWTHQLNANPFNAIVRNTGLWSLRFLCLGLAVTPLRWLTGWHPVVKFRRMLGLLAFFYAAVHLAAYVAFDRVAGLDAIDRSRPVAAAALTAWTIALDATRPFFAIGWVAFLVMVPLAATSTAGMIRWLGGIRWQLLHRLVYLAAIASVLHTYWPLTTHAPRYAVILGVILALRLARAVSRSGPVSKPA